LYCVVDIAQNKKNIARRQQYCNINIDFNKFVYLF